MELYLLRHGIAEDSAAGGRDADRALTSEGKRKLRDLLRIAAQADVRLSLIISSPYKRARQSADVAARVFDYSGDVLETTSIVPNSAPQELWEEIRVHKSTPKLLLVSHEPLLGSAAAFLLNSPPLQVDFKKGALMRIDIEGFSAQPNGLLKWYLTPRLIA